MGRPQSFRSKAAHFVSDLTTVFLNPISDKPSKPSPPPSSEAVDESKGSQNGCVGEESPVNVVDGPDTSSFSAFLYSLLSSESGGTNANSDEQIDNQTDRSSPLSDSVIKGDGGKRSLLSKGKQSLSRVVSQAARFGGNRSQERKDNPELKVVDGNDSDSAGVEMRHIQKAEEPLSVVNIPDISEPSLLMTEKTRTALYTSLPALVQGRKWLLLYSTWRHGISLSTLYRKSILWPGLSLLVVGDRKGAVFGGLVEAPLRPTNKKYQGTNDTFVFTNTPGHPVIFRPTAVDESKGSQNGCVGEESPVNVVDGPDTSSFSAFLYSLLSSESGGTNANSDEQIDNQTDRSSPLSDSVIKGDGGKRSLLSKGKQSLSRVVSQAARFGGNRSQERKDNPELKVVDGNDSDSAGVEMRHIQKAEEPLSVVNIPDISEPSLLMTEKTRTALYTSLPALVQGRKWLLLYSTWRHGISLSTLYRKSILWPGLSLLVVGDRKGAVFGGLVEAPLRPTNKKYQGTNDTFVFTNTPGHPVIFRPTGANRYFTLCSTDFLAIGGGSHFALYLDSDLLSGSSSVSETYGNPCLANSEDFEVKEVELWGFVHATRYEEMLALSHMEAPGICRW